VQVSLGHILVTLFQVHILKTSDQKNPLPLAKMNWFYNKCLIILLFIKLRSEVIHLLGQYPCLGEKVVFRRENLMHPHQILAQVIFPR
jgi:hypothetical protein